MEVSPKVNSDLSFNAGSFGVEVAISHPTRIVGGICLTLSLKQREAHIIDIPDFRYEQCRDYNRPYKPPSSYNNNKNNPIYGFTYMVSPIYTILYKKL